MRPVTLLSILTLIFCTSVVAQQVTIGGSDIGGVVSGPEDPEADVWVIAATTDLPVRFARIVLTDERGRLNERLIAFKDGKGSAPLAVRFQLRPDPLAR